MGWLIGERHTREERAKPGDKMGPEEMHVQAGAGVEGKAAPMD